MRKVKLALSHVSIWSVLKVSFLIGIGVGIATVVVFWIVWNSANSAHIFTTAQEKITEIAGESQKFDILQYVEYSKVMSFGVLAGVANVVIVTVVSLLGALLYNVIALLVGGIHVTFTDD